MEYNWSFLNFSDNITGFHFSANLDCGSKMPCLLARNAVGLNATGQIIANMFLNDVERALNTIVNRAD